MSATKTINMTEGATAKNVIRFALPFAFTTILQLLFNTVNMIVVGQFVGDDAVGAIGVTSSIISLIVNLFTGISAGVTVVVAKYFGAQKAKDISQSVHTAIGLSIVCGVILTTVGICFADFMLAVTDTPSEFMADSKTYLKLYFAGMLPFLVYNFGSSILRGVGDTKRPLVFLSMGLIANVVTSLLLVGVFGMGIAGAGVATIVAQVCSAFLVVVCLIREHSVIKLHLKKICFHKDKVLQILATGIPMGIQSSMMALSNVFLQGAVNSLGKSQATGNSAAANLESYAYAFIQGAYQGTVAFVAQNFGAGNSKRIHKSPLSAFGVAMGLGLVVGHLMWFLRDPLVSMFVSEPVVKGYAFQRSLIMIPYFMVGFMEISAAFTVGSGRAIYASITNLFCLAVLRIAWIKFVFPLPEFHSLIGLYLCYPITWILSGVINLSIYFILKKSITRDCEKNAKIKAEGQGV